MRLFKRGLPKPAAFHEGRPGGRFIGFDFEELDKADVVEAAAPEAQTILPQRPAARPSDATAVQPAAKVDMRGRRLIVLFFDLSSMQPEELQRAVKAAHDYVDQKLSPARQEASARGPLKYLLSTRAVLIQAGSHASRRPLESGRMLQT